MASSFVADTVGAEDEPSCDATLTVGDAVDVVVSGECAESVTWSSNAYLLPEANVLAGTVQVTVEPAAWPDPLLVVQYDDAGP